MAKLLVEDCKLQDLLKLPEQFSVIAALNHNHYTNKTLLWGLIVLEGVVLLYCSILKPFCTEVFCNEALQIWQGKRRSIFVVVGITD